MAVYIYSNRSIYSKSFIFICTFRNKLRRNPPGNWVILTFSGQKPCSRIFYWRILHLFSYTFQGLRMLLVICNNSKENFSRESEKMNVKFHENRENTGKILKISDVILWNLPFIYLFFLAIYFLALPWEIFFGVITDD